MKFKYVRIQGREINANTKYGMGVFSMCWKMVQDDVMDAEDADLYKEIDSWFVENLPFPPQCMNKENVVCFFKTENADLMMKMITPAMWLLERYNQPFYVVYTNTPGEIVYEDEYQVAVRAEEAPVVEHYEHGWVEEG